MTACHSQDYIEIACMYRFEVKLTLKDGESIQGQALDTTYNDCKEECILIGTGQGEEKVVLARLASMQAVTKNPHFSEVKFAD